MSQCGRFAEDIDGTCVWCTSPEPDHPEVECRTCDGWGVVRGMDGSADRCPDACNWGVVPGLVPNLRSVA